jgi:hypothetical protein
MLGHWQMPPKWYRAASQPKDYRDRLQHSVTGKLNSLVMRIPAC